MEVTLSNLAPPLKKKESANFRPTSRRCGKPNQTKSHQLNLNVNVNVNLNRLCIIKLALKSVKCKPFDGSKCLPMAQTTLFWPPRQTIKQRPSPDK